MSLSIKKYAEAGGVGVETVRFYQRKGLLETPGKEVGMRRYGEADIRRLRFIRMAQHAGFTLEEIRELLALDSGQDRQRARELAQTRIAKLNEQITQMEQARNYLQKLARQCTSKASGPCPILASFDG
ncbi:MerR family DNA-binding protein [Pseudoxanthomonas mexicana]|uniref:Mercuric resistance operon regulatory protein n=1 Tax=Pseudoxanthomonas mexicana TaxID=128785 RepID=A0A7G9T9L8_PSEMX|nr:MerR family DNA-binding protein [Pseudoxanthomonas mexicana]QNN76793.1 MerR family DNA-binding protein [Pseudoxanthomonas mexicana]